MPAPATYSDYWQLSLRINFNSVGSKGTTGQSRGWTEKYYFNQPAAYSNPAKNPPVAAAVQLIQARAALMGGNVNIVRNTLSLASGYRDRWPVGNVVTYPLTTFGDLGDPDFGYCNDIETALLFRFENNGQSFTHEIRGIRDAWVDDESLIVDTLKASYGPYNSTVAPYISFDTGPLPVVMSASSVTGVNGVITFTNTGGILSLPVIGTAGAGLSIDGLTTGVFKDIVVQGGTVVYPNNGFYRAKIDITLTAGAITAVALTQANDNKYIYPAGTQYIVPVDADPLTLAQFLDDKVYINNFGSAVASLCSWFHAGAVPVGSFIDANTTLAWPAGSSIPVASNDAPWTIVNNGTGQMRFMVERVASRKTGRMYINKVARKKRAS